MRGQVDVGGLEAAAVVVVVVVIVADLPVDDAPIVVRGIEGGEDPPGHAEIMARMRHNRISKLGNKLASNYE